MSSRGQLCAMLLSFAIGLLVAPDTEARRLVHTVKKGDSLSRIAYRYGVTVAAIKRLNRRKIKGQDRIKIGHTLRLPRSAKRPTPKVSTPRGKLVKYRVKPRDILGRIAKKFGTTEKAILALNRRVKNANSIRVGMTLNIRTAPGRPGEELCPRKYTVQPRDWNVSAIAKKLGISKMALLYYNPKRLKNPDLVRIGQTLRYKVPCPPAISTSQSVGRANAGRLINGVKLNCKSTNPWYCRTPHKSWGTQETIRGLTEAIWEVFNKHPGSHRITLEHISAKNGGHLRPHKSHQSGRDVDLGMYFKNQPPIGPKRFVNGANGKLDCPRTWTLLRALIEAKASKVKVQYIFLDYEVQGVLYRWAKKQGKDEQMLRRMFQYPRGKRRFNAIVRHVPGHRGHLHIRFRCPKGDKDCR